MWRWRSFTITEGQRHWSCWLIVGKQMTTSLPLQNALSWVGNVLVCPPVNPSPAGNHRMRRICILRHHSRFPGRPGCTVKSTYRRLQISVFPDLSQDSNRQTGGTKMRVRQSRWSVCTVPRIMMVVGDMQNIQKQPFLQCNETSSWNQSHQKVH